MAKIIFTEDDEVNGVPITKGTEMDVSYSIESEKIGKGVAELVKEQAPELKTKKSTKEVEDGTQNI